MSFLKERHWTPVAVLLASALVACAVLWWALIGSTEGICLNCDQRLSIEGVPDSLWRSSSQVVHPAPALLVPEVSQSDAEHRVLSLNLPGLGRDTPPRLMRTVVANVEYMDTHSRVLKWLVYVRLRKPVPPFSCNLGGCPPPIYAYLVSVDASTGVAELRFGLE